jgi:acyl dehydratase
MADQTYFEDVREGQELPAIKIAPDKQQLVKFAAGSGDFNPLHFDENFPMLKPMGLTENIVHGRFKYAQVGRLVFGFAGYQGRVKKFAVQYRGMDGLNKTITAKGVVTAKRQEDDTRNGDGGASKPRLTRRVALKEDGGRKEGRSSLFHIPSSFVLG